MCHATAARAHGDCLIVAQQADIVLCQDFALAAPGLGIISGGGADALAQARVADDLGGPVVLVQALCYAQGRIVLEPCWRPIAGDEAHLCRLRQPVAPLVPFRSKFGNFVHRHGCLGHEDWVLSLSPGLLMASWALAPTSVHVASTSIVKAAHPFVGCMAATQSGVHAFCVCVCLCACVCVRGGGACLLPQRPDLPTGWLHGQVLAGRPMDGL